MVALSLLLCALSTAVGTAVGLANFRDVGYPDSSDLLRIGEFIHTGHIYPDGDRPPYLVSLYGPLTYVLLSVPYRLAQSVGVTPQLPDMRLLAIVCAVCLCISLIYLISRRLYNSRSIALLCALFALSTLPMAQEVGQPRFAAISWGSAVSAHECLLVAGQGGRPQSDWRCRMRRACAALQTDIPGCADKDVVACSLSTGRRYKGGSPVPGCQPSP